MDLLLDHLFGWTLSLLPLVFLIIGLVAYPLLIRPAILLLGLRRITHCRDINYTQCLGLLLVAFVLHCLAMGRVILSPDDSPSLAGSLFLFTAEVLIMSFLVAYFFKLHYFRVLLGWMPLLLADIALGILAAQLLAPSQPAKPPVPKEQKICRANLRAINKAATTFARKNPGQPITPMALFQAGFLDEKHLRCPRDTSNAHTSYHISPIFPRKGKRRATFWIVDPQPHHDGKYLAMMAHRKVRLLPPKKWNELLARRYNLAFAKLLTPTTQPAVAP